MLAPIRQMIGGWARRAEDVLTLRSDGATGTFWERVVQGGWIRILRVVMTALWLVALLQVPTVWRADLLHPAAIGSDLSNYLGASERLAEGHAIYGLVAGDRPAPLDNPPEWSVPILSPPPTAAAYLPATWLPDVIAYHLLWAAGLAATAALGIYVMLAAPLPFGLVVLYAPQYLAVTAWSGNINALVGPIAAFAWWATRRHRPRLQLAAGVAIAMVAAIKLGPAFLGLWLLARRRWTAVAGGAIAGAAIAGATVLLAGSGVVSAYLGVVRDTAAAPNELSIPGALASFGIVRLQMAGFGIVMLAVVAGVVLIRDERLSFSIAVLGMVFATTVVREESIAVGILAVAAAWAAPRHTASDRESAAEGDAGSPAPPRLLQRLPGLSRHAAVAMTLGVAAAALGVGASLLRDGTVRSNLAITNTGSQPLVVRLTMPAQEASFGFRIDPRQTAYGWRDEFGASPPVVTIWTPDCELIDTLDLPSAGAHVEAAPTGARVVAAMPRTAGFAPYVPDCAPELIALIDL